LETLKAENYEWLVEELSELLGFWTSIVVIPVILDVIHHHQNPLESTW
jgi:hypothetical protein